MKVVPKVNKNGLYLEDVIVDDTFTGVVPFYADLHMVELLNSTESERVEEQPEPEVAGYIVGIPVPPGLFHPRFDLAGWEARNVDDMLDPSTYWKEGLTPEQIAELTQPRPQEPSELDRIGAELVERELEVLELKLQNEALGAQIVGLELRVLDIENQGGETNV